ncbi:hypothetical protein H2204_009321 [Knufia peltigerae]|uniref:MYND-type domain-containing protein n=1 Tax=Knufia peltigerae TaxID=1002370 RepID=A0AA38XY76_9EURO|nr:hypothetical protein H2204_009321 [Knufia peltigerae]
MGRWGHRVFEGDNDLDLKSDIIGAIREKLKAKPITFEEDDLENLFSCKANPNKQQTPLSTSTQKLRDDTFRQKEDQFYGEYIVVILGAVMMEAGVRISTENMTYLRQAAEKVESYPGYRLPIGDLGFRDPGMAQFLAALSHYQDGEPRDWDGPSCFYCGCIQQDINPRSLLKCGRCKQAWYCGKECQKANWKNHKLICHKDGIPPITPGGFTMLNV